MLNKTNAVETNKSAEKFARKIFPDKHTIEQLKRKKSILLTQNHINQMYEETKKIEQLLTKDTPNITDTLETNKSIKEFAEKLLSDKYKRIHQMKPKLSLSLQDYANGKLKKIEEMEQILNNTPDATNAHKTDPSVKKN